MQKIVASQTIETHATESGPREFARSTEVRVTIDPRLKNSPEFQNKIIRRMNGEKNEW